MVRVQLVVLASTRAFIYECSGIAGLVRSDSDDGHPVNTGAHRLQGDILHSPGIDIRRYQPPQLRENRFADTPRKVVTSVSEVVDLLTDLIAIPSVNPGSNTSALPRTGPVFRGRQGRALQQSTLQRWFTLWCQRAGLTTDNGHRFTLHSLRRFAAKQWLNHGLNIRHVQILLSHNDLQTTIRYLNYHLDEIQHAAQHVDFGLSPQ